MPELEPFNERLEAAVHVFADRAQTSVDAGAVAQVAMGRRRSTWPRFLGAAVPVPVSLLILIALLVLALAATLGIGVGRERQGMMLPAPSASPVSLAASTPPDAATDGVGSEVLSGSLTLAMTAPYTESRAAGVTRLRNGVITTTARMSDPRTSGTGTWLVNADRYVVTGPWWGTYRLENAGGAWEGTCSGSLGDAGAGAALSCWLIGSGAYDGYSYYLSAAGSDTGPDDVRGVIVPAAPPEP